MVISATPLGASPPTVLKVLAFRDAEELLIAFSFVDLMTGGSPSALDYGNEHVQLNHLEERRN